MNFKNELKVLDSLNMLLEKKPLEVYKIYCENNGLVEPCENTEECLEEEFGPDFKERVCVEYSPEHKFAALNENDEICSTDDLSCLCELKALAEDFLNHYNTYMALKQCPVEDSTTRYRKIKDALINVPDDVLLNIIMNYNHSNGFSQIYHNTPDNLIKLKEKGLTPNCSYSEECKYCQPTQNHGIESYDDPMTNVSEDDLIPYIDENYDQYSQDLNLTSNEEEPESTSPDCELNFEDLSKADIKEEQSTETECDLVKDSPIMLNSEWFNSHWKQTPPGILGQKAREQNVARILSMVKEEDFELFKELRTITNRWYKDPTKELYNALKNEFEKIFARNDKEEINQDTVLDLKEKIKNAFIFKTGRQVSEYSELPKRFRETFDLLIENGKINKINALIKELTQTENQKKQEAEEEDKFLTENQKKEKLANIMENELNFEVDKNFSDLKSIENFCKEKEFSFAKFKNYLSQTLEAYLSRKISSDDLKKYFNKISLNIWNSENGSWINPEEKKEKAENEEMELAVAENLVKEIPEEIKKTNQWKKWFPHLVSKNLPTDSNEYKAYLGEIVKRARKEIYEENPNNKKLIEVSKVLFNNCNWLSSQNDPDGEIEDLVNSILENMSMLKNAYYNSLTKKLSTPESTTVISAIKKVLTNKKSSIKKEDVIKALEDFKSSGDLAKLVLPA